MRSGAVLRSNTMLHDSPTKNIDASLKKGVWHCKYSVRKQLTGQQL
jgi:hypothetical protein